MLKYAFVMNIPGETPQSYSGVYKNEKSYNLVAGTGSMEMAEEFVKKLADDGFSLINLCGDFDDAITERMRKATGGSVKIRHADYTSEELAKIEALDDLSEYGVIIVDEAAEKTEYIELKSGECNSYIKFVKNMDAAEAAAAELIEKGVYFIELCSYFNRDKTEKIIAAIDGKIPVGTCGEL